MISQCRYNHSVIFSMTHNKLKYFILAVAALFGMHTAKAQDTIRLTVAQARAYAMNNNTDVRNAVLELESANRKIWETTAIGLPQVSAKAAYSNIFKVPEVSFGSFLDPSRLPVGVALTADDIQNAYVTSPPIALGVKENTTLDLTVSQLIFNGSYIVGLQAARIYYQLSDQNLERTRQDVAETVTDTYTMLLVARENIRILEETILNVAKIRDETREMFRQGFVEQTDADQLEVTYNNLKISLDQVKSGYDIGMRLLKIQLGVQTGSAVVLTDPLDKAIDLVSIGKSIQQPFVLENNILYKLLSTQERLALLDLRREKSEFLPTISAFYNRQERTNTPEFDFQPKDMLGVNLSMNLFSSGQRLAKVKQKKISLEQTRNLKDVQSRNLRLQAEQLSSELSVKRDKYLTSIKNRDLAMQIYERSVIKYKEGVGSSLDLTMNQNQYLTALSGYYQAIFEMLSAQTKLDKVLNNLAVNHE